MQLMPRTPEIVEHERRLANDLERKKNDDQNSGHQYQRIDLDALFHILGYHSFLEGQDDLPDTRGIWVSWPRTRHARVRRGHM
jgi:hypothetical protein